MAQAQMFVTAQAATATGVALLYALSPGAAKPP
jgi:hypothetical protein